MKKISESEIAELVSWFKEQEAPPSIQQCMDRSGLSRDTVRRYLKKNGLSVPVGTRRGSSRGTYKKKDPLQRKCKICQSGFQVESSSSRKEFCSDECREMSRTKNFPICPCGTKTTWYDRKYCSQECVNKYSIPVRYADNRLTKTCLGCGEEFTGPKYYMQGRKYCSNRCAKKEQKRGWGKTGVQTPDGVLVLRSMYELRFVAVCERRGWDWKHYDGPEIETSLGNYRPDFIVNGRPVEVKGWLGPDAVTKLEEAREQGVDIWLIDRHELVELETAKS